MSIAEKLTVIAKNNEEIWDAGYNQGLASGKYEGRQEEYNAFWDNYQQNGNRNDYTCGFAGKGWSKSTFNPKYDIVPTSGTEIFFHFNELFGALDLVEHLADKGVSLDFSRCTSMYSAFAYSSIKRLGCLDLTKVGTDSSYYLQGLFIGSSIITIDEIIVKSTTLFHSGSFQNCTKLKDITFSGEIGCNLNFQHSPLTMASIASIVDNLSTTASGKTVTFKKSAVNKAFETSSGANDGSTSEYWTTLIQPYSNWTISLV